jgi:hypothetical protein
VEGKVQTHVEGKHEEEEDMEEEEMWMDDR